MRRYTDYVTGGKTVGVPSLLKRMIGRLDYLVSLRILGEATQRVRLQPEVVRVNRKYPE